MTEREVPGTPWDIEIDILMRTKGVSLEEARNAVIFDGLKKGDVNALCALLIQGIAPPPTILKYLALMMPVRFDGPMPSVSPPFGFIIKSRNGTGRRKSKDAELRDRLLAANVQKSVSEGFTTTAAYEKAGNLMGTDAAGRNAEMAKEAHLKIKRQTKASKQDP